MQLPISFVNWLYTLPFTRRPDYLSTTVDERPAAEDLPPGVVLVEVRDGYLKWAHFQCPVCGEHIQLPLAGKERWSFKDDLLHRPTFTPSVWERSSCGAHFFITKGRLLWC